MCYSINSCGFPLERGQMYIFDTDGRPRLAEIECPRCGHKHGYAWGYAPPRTARPNGGCPECKTTWVIATGEVLGDPATKVAQMPQEGGPHSSDSVNTLK